MTILVTLLGITLNALVLQDIFRTLFVPTGAGALSSFAARRVWRVFRQAEQRRPAVLALAGPLILLCIIVVWAVGLAIGWALIVWPHLPTGFHLATGMDPADHGGFVDALYLSLVTLATLGYGDIVPASGWLRVVVPLEALVGFALGTASISWILSISPVLARRRHLAREVFLLGRSEQDDLTIVDADPQAVGAVLLSLTEQVIALRNDLAQVPIIYYFHTPDRDRPSRWRCSTCLPSRRRPGVTRRPASGCTVSCSTKRWRIWPPTLRKRSWTGRREPPRRSCGRTPPTMPTRSIPRRAQRRFGAICMPNSERDRWQSGERGELRW